jgi:hypothetical protein
MNVKATIDIQDVREGIVLIIHVATMLGRKKYIYSYTLFHTQHCYEGICVIFFSFMKKVSVCI